MVRTCFVLFLSALLFVGTRSEPVCTDHNEVLDECPGAICRPLRCSAKRDTEQLICPVVTKCRKGCVCKEGYLKDENDVCIPEDKCKSNPCPFNELWSNCTQMVCRQQECSKKKEQIISCGVVEDKECVPGCVCDRGFFRVKGGWCAPEEQCDYHESLETGTSPRA